MSSSLGSLGSTDISSPSLTERGEVKSGRKSDDGVPMLCNVSSTRHPRFSLVATMKARPVDDAGILRRAHAATDADLVRQTTA